LFLGTEGQSVIVNQKPSSEAEKEIVSLKNKLAKANATIVQLKNQL